MAVLKETTTKRIFFTKKEKILDFDKLSKYQRPQKLLLMLFECKKGSARQVVATALHKVLIFFWSRAISQN